jgi:hypothetical protein
MPLPVLVTTGSDDGEGREGESRSGSRAALAAAPPAARSRSAAVTAENTPSVGPFTPGLASRLDMTSLGLQMRSLKQASAGEAMYVKDVATFFPTLSRRSGAALEAVADATT